MNILYHSLYVIIKKAKAIESVYVWEGKKTLISKVISRKQLTNQETVDQSADPETEY